MFDDASAWKLSPLLPSTLPECIRPFNDTTVSAPLERTTQHPNRNWWTFLDSAFRGASLSPKMFAYGLTGMIKLFLALVSASDDTMLLTL